MNGKNNKMILVVGMHRSGTSAVMAGLQALGVDPGDDLMAANEENPKGFFENRSVVKLNDEILEYCGGSWNNPFMFDLQRRLEKLPEHFYHRAGDILSGFCNAPLWGVKDPRLSLLLPFWEKVLNVFGNSELYLLHALRHPLSVAASLKIRSEKPANLFYCGDTRHSLLLWFVYHYTLLANLCTERNMVVFFDDLLADPEKQLRRMAEFLGGEPSEEDVRQYGADFLDRGLRHHKYIADQVGELYPEFSFVDTFYQQIFSFKDEPEFTVEQCRNLIDGLASPEKLFEPLFRVGQPVFQRADKACRLEKLIIDLEEIVSVRDSRIRSLEEEVSSRDSHISHLEEEVSSLDDRIKGLEEKLSVMIRSNSWRITRPYRWMRRIVSSPGKWLTVLCSKLIYSNNEISNPKDVQYIDNTKCTVQGENPVLSENFPVDERSVYADRELYNKLCVIGSNEQRCVRKIDMISLQDEDISKIMNSVVFSSVDSGKLPELSIVIPVYNASRETVECLLSVDRFLRERSCELIIADDCSDDPAVKDLFGGRPDLRYMRNDENIGFLKNVNRAVAEAKGEFVLLLNSDVQLLNDVVSVFKQEMSRHQDVVLIGPKILFPDGRLQEAGSSIDKNCRTVMNGMGDDPDNPLYNYNRYVDYISGACWFFRRDFFGEMGGLEEEYAPAYFEDVEFCARIAMKGYKVLYTHQAEIVHHLSVSSNSISPGFKVVRSALNRKKFIDRYGDYYKIRSQLKVIAFYLPQFHAIRENDFWWGKGFTEWRSVAKAIPLFNGHYQPHLPADLGFYDLTEGKVFEKQALLARQSGIFAFCFYYYNFNGKELLEKALDAFLSSDADIKFCLCWANENWTRRWDGMESDVLMEQDGSDEDHYLKVLAGMERFMIDSRYVKVDGKPLLLIYRATLLDSVDEMLAVWRDYWRKHHGEELYICMVDSMERSTGSAAPPEKMGFDAAVEFPVHNAGAGLRDAEVSFGCEVDFSGRVFNYPEAVANICSRSHPGYKRFPGCFPSWDNTPRKRVNSWVFANAHPTAFQFFLERKTRESAGFSGDEKMIFINAWNEWGEGAHLEPDLKYGHAWLQVVESVVKAF